MCLLLGIRFDRPDNVFRYYTYNLHSAKHICPGGLFIIGQLNHQFELIAYSEFE